PGAAARLDDPQALFWARTPLTRDATTAGQVHVRERAEIQCARRGIHPPNRRCACLRHPAGNLDLIKPGCTSDTLCNRGPRRCSEREPGTRYQTAHNSDTNSRDIAASYDPHGEPRALLGSVAAIA